MVTQVLAVLTGADIDLALCATALADPDGSSLSVTVPVSLAATALVTRFAIRTKTTPQATAIIHCRFFEVLNN
jgi:hypothetical protein